MNLGPKGVMISKGDVQSLLNIEVEEVGPCNIKVNPKHVPHPTGPK
jgi:hypothetical protein